MIKIDLRDGRTYYATSIKFQYGVIVFNHMASGFETKIEYHEIEELTPLTK